MTRLTYALFAATLLATLAPAADPPPLKGTWVREMIVGQRMGNQIVLTFSDKRVTAKMSSGGWTDDGHEGWMSLEFDGEYAVTDGGLVVGVVTGINADLSRIPESDSFDDPFGKTMHKMIGEPFCFRARVVDGALVVTDIKVPNFGADADSNGRDVVVAVASGKYASMPADKVPLPKLTGAKAKGAGILDVVGHLFGPNPGAKVVAVPRMPPPVPSREFTATPVPSQMGMPSSNPGPAFVGGVQPPPYPAVYPNPFPTAEMPSYLPPGTFLPVGGTGTPPPIRTSPLNSFLPDPHIPPYLVPTQSPGVPIHSGHRTDMIANNFQFSTTLPPRAVRVEGVNMDGQAVDGTWVRDLVVPDAGVGTQAVLTFKGDRLTARFAEFSCGDDGKMKSGAFEFECSYHRTSDGYVIGRFVGVELDMKNAPLEHGVTPETLKGLNKIYGEPFCFRCDVRDGVMSVADVRMPTPEGLTHGTRAMRDTAIAFVGGKYRKSETTTVPLPKVERRKYEPPKMEKTMNGIRVVTPFTPHPDLPLTVRATPGPLPGFTPPLPPPAPSNPPTLLPTAGQVLPPGSMKHTPMMPMVREAWNQSTAPMPPN